MKNRFWRVTFVRASFLACIFRGFCQFCMLLDLEKYVFFVESIANLGFLRFLIFPLVVLSETSFWTHFGSIF